MEFFKMHSAASSNFFIGKYLHESGKMYRVLICENEWIIYGMIYETDRQRDGNEKNDVYEKPYLPPYDYGDAAHNTEYIQLFAQHIHSIHYAPLIWRFYRPFGGALF
ncbi:hypothetical protein FACS189421_11000 [Bacteroidia bacterium]|nr:hypothetical protein FACS189421_11000 [Bacteroidia bacterium]